MEDLKIVYKAPTEESALQELELVEAKWEKISAGFKILAQQLA